MLAETTKPRRQPGLKTNGGPNLMKPDHTRFPLVSTEIVQVTPELAAQWLNLNIANRKPKAWVVKSYAAAMERGEWKLSPQGIAFSADGFLLDGQQRLMAVIECGLTVPMLVLRGFQATGPLDLPIDRGSRRNVGESLGFERAVAESVLFLVRLAVTQNDPSEAQAEPYFKRFGKPATSLVETCGTRSRGRTAASTKAAFVLRSVSMGDEVFSQYRSLALLDYNNMTQSMLALNRQIESRLTGGMSTYDLFARVWIAVGNPELSKIQISDLSKTLAMAREEIAAAMRDGQ